MAGCHAPSVVFVLGVSGGSRSEISLLTAGNSVCVYSGAEPRFRGGCGGMLGLTSAGQCEWQTGVSYIPVGVPGAVLLQWG